jgi:hypothetical protein
MRATMFVAVDVDVVLDIDVAVVLDKAPPRMVASSGSVVWNVATFKTERFVPVLILASWCWRNGPGVVGRDNAKALHLSVFTRPSEVTTRQKRIVVTHVNRFVPRTDHKRPLILSERERY